MGRGLPSRPKPAPVPQLEGEDVGRGADFQHHGIGPGTMDGAGGDEEMVVLLGRPLVDILVRGKCGPAVLRLLQVARHGGGIDPFPQAEIDGRPGSGVQQVIALVLRVVHSEMVLDILGERMNLERKIAAAHGVQKVEPDGKLVAEPRMHFLAEQRAGLGEHQVDRGISKRTSPKPEQQAVFFGHAIEAPAIIRALRSRSQTSFIHWPPQGAGSKNGTTRKGRVTAWRSPRRTASPSASLGSARVIGVEHEIPFGDQRPFPAVGDAPVHEERALVLQVAGSCGSRRRDCRFHAGENGFAPPSGPGRHRPGCRPRR